MLSIWISTAAASQEPPLLVASGASAGSGEMTLKMWTVKLLESYVVGKHNFKLIQLEFDMFTYGNMFY